MDRKQLTAIVDKEVTKIVNIKRGQASYLGISTGGWSFGRPSGRIVYSKLRRCTIASTQLSFPNGRPRRAQSRTASNSACVSGSLTRASQCGKRGIGHGESSLGLGSGV